MEKCKNEQCGAIIRTDSTVFIVCLYLLLASLQLVCVCVCVVADCSVRMKAAAWTNRSIHTPSTQHYHSYVFTVCNVNHAVHPIRRKYRHASGQKLHRSHSFMQIPFLKLHPSHSSLQISFLSTYPSLSSFTSVSTRPCRTSVLSLPPFPTKMLPSSFHPCLYISQLIRLSRFYHP